MSNFSKIRPLHNYSSLNKRCTVTFLIKVTKMQTNREKVTTESVCLQHLSISNMSGTVRERKLGTETRSIRITKLSDIIQLLGDSQRAPEDTTTGTCNFFLSANE